jgi:hypothetical protein
MQLQMERQDAVLIARASGEVRLRMTLDVYKQVIDSAVEQGCAGIIIDCLTLQGRTVDFRAIRVRRRGRPVPSCRLKVPRIAFVGTAPTLDGFGVTVGRNRGIDAFIFASEEDALAWLKA